MHVTKESAYAIRERRVSANGLPAHQSPSRTTSIAAAVNTCCGCAFARARPSRRDEAPEGAAPDRVHPNGTRITQVGILLELESRDLLGRYSGGLTLLPITNPGGRRDSGYSHIPTPAIRVPA